MGHYSQPSHTVSFNGKINYNISVLNLFVLIEFVCDTKFSNAYYLSGWLLFQGFLSTQKIHFPLQQSISPHRPPLFPHHCTHLPPASSVYFLLHFSSLPRAPRNDNQPAVALKSIFFQKEFLFCYTNRCVAASPWLYWRGFLFLVLFLWFVRCSKIIV